MWKTGNGWNPELTEDFVRGHEFCGVVTDPEDSGFKIGDRVVYWANMHCGKCDMCLAGKEQLCREVNGQNYIGFVRNGGYAEKFVWKSGNAYKLPDTVSDTAAGLIDPLRVAYHAIKETIENVKAEEVEISKELMVQYGISSMEEFTKARELNVFKENFVHVSEPVNLTNTIFIIKKYGKEMVLITRPSDYEQVILYYGAEKDILDFEKDYDLWVEDGKTTPQQITFGKMLKLTGINRIPLRKVV